MLAKGSTRKDAPPIYNTVRGDKRKARKAFAVAADDDLMDEAMTTYEKDWKAAGDVGPYYYKTWCDFHRARWDGIRRPRLPVFPSTVMKIHTVGALLKIGGYRSSKNFIQEARTAHAESDRHWGPALDLAGRRFVASTLRGIGPPRQSEPISFEAAPLLTFPVIRRWFRMAPWTRLRRWPFSLSS